MYEPHHTRNNHSIYTIQTNNMEKTQHQDLVVGKLYSDIEPNDYVPLVILEFIKQDQDTLYFKHLSGPNAYTETDGLIEFHPPNHFTPCS